MRYGASRTAARSARSGPPVEGVPSPGAAPLRHHSNFGRKSDDQADECGPVRWLDRNLLFRLMRWLRGILSGDGCRDLSPSFPWDCGRLSLRRQTHCRAGLRILAAVGWPWPTSDQKSLATHAPGCRLMLPRSDEDLRYGIEPDQAVHRELTVGAEFLAPVRRLSVVDYDSATSRVAVCCILFLS